ncbi:WbqC family protein [Thalassomonas viridans]|uniref:WbqC family protein n=1 Tax=Thalassomonas viridans TaxID=137584 RepID=A0AAF0C7E4_9GAMM|nr:WbqC family protein [Thalassomonas viridans]WDE05217.1 WbqC family protein [Thalassomonas viridans]
MKIAIMQPYFMPYIGYFQLLAAVDKFVIYDEIQYSKQGWINRNRILQNGKDAFISLPLKKASDYLFVNQRFLAEGWQRDKVKLLNRLAESYRKAPYFDDAFPLIREIMACRENNLFGFILNSLTSVLSYLDIKTSLVISSSLPDIQALKAQDKVIDICRQLQATQYINPIGGLELYDKNHFGEHGISLNFLQTDPIRYRQFGQGFVPCLSIIDVLMFNSAQEIRDLLPRYRLL